MEYCKRVGVVICGLPTFVTIGALIIKGLIALVDMAKEFLGGLKTLFF
jgi:hypothetical protein